MSVYEFPTDEEAGYYIDAEEQSRAFNIQTVSWDNHQLTGVGIESRADFDDERPADWQERLRPLMEGADIAFVAYFPPELEETVYKSPVFGTFAAHYANKDYKAYEDIADLAAETGTTVGVADIANNMGFMAYEFFLPNALMYGISAMRDKGVASLQPNLAERLIPSPTDARRLFTAAVIQQEMDHRPEGSNVLYIAAPAHVTRVLRYATEGASLLDRWRYETYKHTPGFYQGYREYQYEPESGWQKTVPKPTEQDG